VISVNKLSPKIKYFTLIAMVREKDGNRLVVEDNTGEAIVNADKEKIKFIVEDEVIGLVCEQEQGITVKQIIWPDIPIGRTVNKTEEEIICIFTKATDGADYEKLDKSRYVFLFGEGENKNKTFFITQNPSVSTLPDPSIVGVGNIKILLSSSVEKYAKLWNVSIETAQQNLLKKRHLDPRIELKNMSVQDMLIDEIPDIMVSPTSDKPSIINYKGTTIISTNYPQCAGVNLKTRETFKIDMA
jgi:hypothetical protein